MARDTGNDLELLRCDAGEGVRRPEAAWAVADSASGHTCLMALADILDSFRGEDSDGKSKD